MENLDETLESLIARRNKITETLERLKGRKEQAEANLAAVEQECREKNIDPDAIDSIIEQLEAKYTTLVTQLQTDMEQAEATIQPFLGAE